MKKYIKVYVSFLALLFLCFAFVYMDFSPHNWGKNSRAIFAVGAIVLIIISAFISDVVFANKEKIMRDVIADQIKVMEEANTVRKTFDERLKEMQEQKEK